MKAYWFSDKDGLTQNMRDHNMPPAEIGRTDSMDGDIVPCERGFHGSPTPWNALHYANGEMLWEVEISDDAIPHGEPVDKYASQTRRYLRRCDLTKLLRKFASQQALSVIELWNAPKIVVQYLRDEEKGIDRSYIRAAAWDAAWDAARARAVGQEAAWAAARKAAWAAARAAAQEAAWAAAREAAWAAARAAPHYAATCAAARDELNMLAIKALDEIKPTFTAISKRRATLLK